MTAVAMRAGQPENDMFADHLWFYGVDLLTLLLPIHQIAVSQHIMHHSIVNSFFYTLKMIVMNNKCVLRKNQPVEILMIFLIVLFLYKFLIFSWWMVL
jgi:hypothetical protein